MHFISTLTLISCIFHAFATVLAHRRSEHHSRLLDLAERSDKTNYTSTFAGAALTTFEEGGTFNEASGTITVPQFHNSPDSCLSVFVGIDMVHFSGSNYVTCSGALSAGVDIIPSQNGADGSSNPTYQYIAWYHGTPDNMYTPFPNFTLSAGDVIRLSVYASSATSGFATVENLTTAQTATQHINPTGYLCGVGAGWFISLIKDCPLAQFSELTFYDATVIGTENRIYTPADATTYDIFNVYEDANVLGNARSLQVTSTEIQGIYLIVQDLYS